MRQLIRCCAVFLRAFHLTGCLALLLGVLLPDDIVVILELVHDLHLRAFNLAGCLALLLGDLMQAILANTRARLDQTCCARWKRDVCFAA